jgi:hypothetical protein
MSLGQVIGLDILSGCKGEGSGTFFLIIIREWQAHFV